MGLMGAGLGTSGVGLAWDFYVHEIVRDVGEVESIFAPPHLMIWGIVAPAIFVSYALLGILVGFPSDGDGSHALRVLFPVLWAPWAAIGLVATATLWRSVGLVIPRRSAQRWEGLLTGAIIVGIIFAGFAAIAVAKVPVAEFAWVLTAQGVGVVTVGLLGLNCNDATERRLWLLGRILLAAVALAGSLLLGADILLARQWFTLISPLTSGLVLFGGGLYLTSRA